jgi:NhaC family Na+:H+ antiporter
MDNKDLPSLPLALLPVLLTLGLLALQLFYYGDFTPHPAFPK